MKKSSPPANLMVDVRFIEKIIAYSDLKPSETVLEIGAGTGNLTVALAEKAGRVYAIERNTEFCGGLKKRFSGKRNVEIICGDALRIKFPEYDKIVSNLPYEISKKITERFLTEGFKYAVLVYQKEFAQKLVAKPGNDNYRFISALAQSCAEIEVLDTIPPNAFSPQPAVDSSIVRMRQTMVPEEDYVIFLRDLFNHKNKMLRTLIDVDEEFSEKRPCELSPQELRRVYTSFCDP